MHLTCFTVAGCLKHGLSVNHRNLHVSLLNAGYRWPRFEQPAPALRLMQIPVKMTGRKGEKCPHRSDLFKIHFLRCPPYPMLLSNKRFPIRSKSLRWLFVLSQGCNRLVNSSENKFKMVYSILAWLSNRQLKSCRQPLSSLLPLWVKKIKDREYFSRLL